MGWKNGHHKHSRVLAKKFRQILRYFAMDSSASDTAKLTGISVKGDLQHTEIIFGFIRLLVLYVLFPYFVCHVSTRRYPIPSRPQILTPISLPQGRVLRQQLVRTLAFEELYRFRYRQIWRNYNQHVHMISVDRARIDDHFLTTRNLPQQLSTPEPNISIKNRITVLRHPNQVVLTIPDRTATVLVILHGFELTIPTPPPESAGFTDPLSGTLNDTRIYTLMKISSADYFAIFNK